MKETRIAVIVSHPIQHFCPQYSSWAALDGVSLRVFFASRHGLSAYQDKNFDRVIHWEGMALDFPHEFLPGAEGKPLGRRIDSPPLAKRLSEFSPHVIVVYGYSEALQRRAIAWGVSAKVPVLMIADSELRRHRGRLQRIAKALILPRILGKIDRFLTVGDANEAYYRNYGITDDRFIRCSFPIDVKNFDAALEVQEKAREMVRLRHGIPQEHRVLLKVGKLVPRKRQCDLVDFSNSTKGEESNITVVFAGTGPDEANLRARTRRHGAGGVVFAGFVPPTKLIEYYCAADVYVHCSEREPHSLAISEAIYCGLPVVLSDCCGSYGPSDDVRVGLNGHVYRCSSLGELSSAIWRVVNSEDRRQAMGLASMEIARANQKLAHGRALLQAVESIRSLT